MRALLLCPLFSLCSELLIQMQIMKFSDPRLKSPRTFWKGSGENGWVLLILLLYPHKEMKRRKQLQGLVFEGSTSGTDRISFQRIMLRCSFRVNTNRYLPGNRVYLLKRVFSRWGAVHRRRDKLRQALNRVGLGQVKCAPRIEAFPGEAMSVRILEAGGKGTCP